MCLGTSEACKRVSPVAAAGSNVSADANSRILTTVALDRGALSEGTHV